MSGHAKRRRVLVCQGLFCSAQGSHRVLAELQGHLKGREDIVVERYLCFNGCGHGPNVVVHPDRLWYEGVRPSEIATIVAHLDSGEDPGREPGQRIPAVVKEAAFGIVESKYGERG